MLCAMSVMGGNGRHTPVVDERDDAKEADGGKVTLSMVLRYFVCRFDSDIDFCSPPELIL